MQQQVNRMMNAAQKIVLAMALFTGTVSEALAIVNPASFFKKMGGVTEIVKQANVSKIGLGKLSDGNIIEEGSLFRKFNGGQ
ncbi:MAG: DUF333 domain-containing protein [Pantoea vagans]|nr:DUF333 domain-containing protein [Pantoea vagans]